MLDIYTQAARVIREGRRAAMATITSTKGSTPGKQCAKMLVLDDGSTFGTVGGGCTESDIWHLATEVIANQIPVTKSFRLSAATAAETGLLCGGEFEVFIEPIGAPAIVVFGAGHIAQCLEPLLKSLDYRLSIVDDRESFVDAKRFPKADKLIVQDFETAFEGLEVGPNTCIIIVTRGHEHDETVLRQAVKTHAGYIGLIGSRAKISAIFKNLKNEGIDPSKLESVHAPIGLDIGAKSPEEIAISIAAELVALQRGIKLHDSGAKGSAAGGHAKGRRAGSGRNKPE